MRAWAGSARRDAGAPGADAMPDAPASAPEPSVHAAPGAQRLLAAVCVRDDNRASWLRAGQAAQRVLLLAASAGMHAAPLGAVPEGPDTPVRHDPRFGGEHPTMVLGLGGEQADLPASRRPASQVLRVMGPVRPKDKGPALAPPAALPAGSRQLMRSQ